MNDEDQEVVAEDAAGNATAAAGVRPAGAPGGYGPIAGVTRGYETGAAAAGADAEDRNARQAAVSGQAVAGGLFLLALVPPLVLCALYGLTGRGPLIVHSMLWAWGAGAISLYLALRLAVPAMMGRGASVLLPLVTTIVFLLTPSGVLLYLEYMKLHPVTTTLGVAGIILYAVCAVALLMVSLSLARTDRR